MLESSPSVGRRGAAFFNTRPPLEGRVVGEGCEGAAAGGGAPASPRTPSNTGTPATGVGPRVPPGDFVAAEGCDTGSDTEDTTRLGVRAGEPLARPHSANWNWGASGSMSEPEGLRGAMGGEDRRGEGPLDPPEPVRTSLTPAAGGEGHP